MLVLVYLMKYATDVLLVPAAVMGVLFGLSRVSDAILDPVAGYLSDRTRSRLGRRRSWMLASSLPMGATFLMLWSPPARSRRVSRSRSGWASRSSPTTSRPRSSSMPHEALGAELSTNHHDRTRIFGVKHIVGTLGSLLALGGMWLLMERRGSAAHGVRARARDRRRASPATTLLAVVRLRERAEHQGRGGAQPLAGLRRRLAQSARAAAVPRLRHRELRHRDPRRADRLRDAVRLRPRAVHHGLHAALLRSGDPLRAGLDPALAALRQAQPVDLLDVDADDRVRRPRLRARGRRLARVRARRDRGRRRRLRRRWWALRSRPT